MKENINLEGNIQYFADSTYKCIPPQNKGAMLFIILAYNEKLNKTLLCTINLIYNENKETFSEIFKFLKLTYQFNSKLFTVDLARGCYLAILEQFPNCRIFPCYFHIIRRLIIHLNNIKSENGVIKRAAKNLLLNMKILLFIDDNELENFYSKIKNKYYDANKKFFKYFEKTFLINRPFKDRQ